MRSDIVVLGAGMVGLGSAIHLLDRGQSVTLVDLRGPAEETSYGNAGLIQSEAVMPYTFPRDPSTILQAAFGLRGEVRVRWRDLGQIAPFLIAYAKAGSVQAARRTARANVPLLARVQTEHEALMDRCGARHLLREGGYLRIYRSSRDLDAAAAVDAAVEREFGVPYAVWDGERLAAAEPHLARPLAGAIHHPAPFRVDDPGDVGKAYAGLFEALGGRFLNGDARTLTRSGDDWAVTTDAGIVKAERAVVALGAWTGDVLGPLGVKLPLGVKRGYHMHYRLRGNAPLNNFVLDSDHGYVITPNRRGIRLTTGVEFAGRDAPSNPAQIVLAEREASALFPLGERVEETPWRGARPCLPDMLPAVGPVPGQAGLYANFGHHHLGFTLGPTTGRLIAEMIVGETPFTDPKPYRLDRF